jgi:hypothetical protein
MVNVTDGVHLADPGEALCSRPRLILWLVVACEITMRHRIFFQHRRNVVLLTKGNVKFFFLPFPHPQTLCRDIYNVEISIPHFMQKRDPAVVLYFACRVKTVSVKPVYIQLSYRLKSTFTLHQRIEENSRHRSVLRCNHRV